MKQVITVILFTLVSISCSKNDNSISQSDLLGCWNHDIENQANENEEGYLLAKCDSNEFPNTWFRYNIVFEENGQGSELLLAENDAHTSGPITWELDLNELTVKGTLEQVTYDVESMEDGTLFLSKK